MFAIILGFITSLVLTYVVIPVIIRVAREKRLYDKPNERSSHMEPTPSLGGIGIFAGSICGIVLWTPLDSFGVLQYILAAFIIIFLIGVMDDLMPIAPKKKLVGQLLVAVILAFKAKIIVSNFHGIFGLAELPEILAFLFSMICIVGIINAFNLIDGINGLAGSIGLIASTFWGVWFYFAGYPAFAVLAFSLAGSIIAFLKYNLGHAKIFMGDTGSLLIGTVCSILAIKFIETNYLRSTPPNIVFSAAPAISVAILILPIFDTLKVFIMRIVHGKSPFHPDKTHIHHMLLDLQCTHLQATGILVAANLLFILMACFLGFLGTATVLAIIISVAMLLSSWLKMMVDKNKTGGKDEG